MHEHDLARDRCAQDPPDHRAHAATSRGPLPAEGVDGPAHGNVAEVVDQAQVAVVESPNGKRKSGRGSWPVVCRIVARALATCLRTCPSVIVGRCGCSAVWLPSRPAAAIRRARAGKLPANCPVRKKLAGTFWLASVARIAFTPSPFAPASKVRATILRLVGRRSTTRPARDVGTGSVGAEAGAGGGGVVVARAGGGGGGG